MNLFLKGIPATKRVFDLIISLLLVILLSPVFMIVTLLVILKLGRPVLFLQQRPGYRSRPFLVYKFRSMTNQRDAQGQLFADANRLTSFGRFLRSSSLDELPELINVIRGEMSLVGPRPLLMKYLDRYSPEQARRHEVLPGITGWAQVNGRNALDWEEKFRLDTWYIDHWSFGLDLKILALTVWRVLRREGISQPGQATAEDFMGAPRSEDHP